MFYTALQNFFKTLLDNKFQTFLTIVVVVLAGGLLEAGLEKIAVGLLIIVVLVIFIYTLVTTAWESRVIETEYFRDPLFSEISCFTEQLSLNSGSAGAKTNHPLSSEYSEIHILTNRSNKFHVRQTRRLERWIHPESKETIKEIRGLNQSEAEKKGFSITQEAICNFKPATVPEMKDMTGFEGTTIFFTVEFLDGGIKPKKTIGLQLLMGGENARKFEDFFWFNPDFPTRKAYIQIIAPPGYSISIIEYSVRDMGGEKDPQVKEDLVSKGQVPFTDPNETYIKWEIKNPITIYNYRVDFKVAKR